MEGIAWEKVGMNGKREKNSPLNEAHLTDAKVQLKKSLKLPGQVTRKGPFHMRIFW